MFLTSNTFRNVFDEIRFVANIDIVSEIEFQNVLF